MGFDRRCHIVHLSPFYFSLCYLLSSLSQLHQNWLQPLFAKPLYFSNVTAWFKFYLLNILFFIECCLTCCFDVSSKSVLLINSLSRKLLNKQNNEYSCRCINIWLLFRFDSLIQTELFVSVFSQVIFLLFFSIDFSISNII